MLCRFDSRRSTRHRLAARSPLGVVPTLVLPVVLGSCIAQTSNSDVQATRSPVTSETLYAEADTYVGQYSSVQNTNFGSAATLYAGLDEYEDNTHALLSFSQAELMDSSNGQPVLSATLRIRDAGLQASLSAHRMMTAWEESGATWNCPDDTNLGNSDPDCASQWEMAGPAVPFDSEPTDVQDCTLVASGAPCDFDVTADVNAFIAGEAENLGWLLRSSGSYGVEAFHAIESSSDEAELILEVPDPGYIPSSCPAPDLDDTKVTRLFDVTEHVHSGVCPVQSAVDPSDIDPQRAAHIRGTVVDSTGADLAGVTVRIRHHAELGWTRTRSDGAWDLVVNGGGRMTVELRKPGYFTVQRTVDVPWNEYLPLDRVVMLSRDDAACDPITSTTGGLHVGDLMDDARGERLAAVYMPSSSTMEIISGGTTISDYCVCSIEHTYDRPDGGGVLPGQEAMPADLPPSTAYTYATDFELREQDGSGGCTDTPIPQPVFRQPSTTCAVATDCASDGSRSCIDGLCEQPAFTYVEDFLGFPIGAAVPTGYYDPSRSGWIGDRDGRVVRIVDDSGTCAFDFDGDPDPETNVPGGPSAHDVTAAELAALNTQCGNPGDPFQVDDVIWRVPMTHFSLFDLNWAVPLVTGLLIPFLEAMASGLPNGECQVGGSIIGCEGQTLSESIPIAGTPWGLHYQSARQRGRVDRNMVRVRIGSRSLTGGTGSTSPDEIRVRVQVAGHSYEAEIDPSAGTLTGDGSYDSGTGIYELFWDGTDAWGRLMQGAQRAKIRVGFAYAAEYAQPEEFDGRSFSLPPDTQLVSTSSEIVFWSTIRGLIGGWDEGAALDGSVRGRGIGGWSLTPHHVYDARAGVLYRGDGTQLRTDGVQPVIDTVAGEDPALHQPTDVAVAPNGTVYIAQSGNASSTGNRIRMLTPTGELLLFAGTGAEGDALDDVAAAAAEFRFGASGMQASLAVRRDGAVLVVDAGNNCVREVRDGRVRRVAGVSHYSPVGSCTTDESGTNGPATDANLSCPAGVAEGPDGSIYISDSGNDRIVRVEPGGRLFEIANVTSPGRLTVSDDGDVYVVVDESEVVRIAIDGEQERVAGGGAGCSGSPADPSGDGGQATDACLAGARSVALANDGSFYIAEWNAPRVRRVASTGIIQTVAGHSQSVCVGCSPARPYGDGGAAASAYFFGVTDVDARSDGTLFIVDRNAGQVRHVRPALPDSVVGDVVVAEPGGGLLYRFDDHGRHIETQSGLNGQTLLDFTYSGTTGLLTEIDSSVSGLGLTLTRNGSGVITAITSSYGDTTTPTFNGDGFLWRVQDPEGAYYTATYWTGTDVDGLPRDGLLETFANDATGTWSFYYHRGRLVRDTSSDGLDQRLTRADCGDGLSGCLEGEAGWQVEHKFYDSMGVATGWQPRLHQVITSGGVLSRSVRSELGVLSRSFAGDLGVDPLESADGVSVPVTSQAVSSAGWMVDIGTAADPRPGLDPYVRAARVLRPAAFDPIPSTSRYRTDITALREVVAPSDPETFLDVTDSSEAITVNGMTDGAAETRTTLVEYHRATPGAGGCANHYETITTPEGYEMTTCFDAAGRVTRRTLPGLEPIKVSYASANGRISGVTMGLRDTQIQHLDAGSNDQWWTSNVELWEHISRGSSTLAEEYSMVRDGRGFLESETHENHIFPFAPSATTGFSVDDFGSITSITTPSSEQHGLSTTDHLALALYEPPVIGSNRPGVLEVPAFDPAHRPEQIDILDGTTLEETIDLFYDPNFGYLSDVQLPGGRTITFVRDVATNPVTIATAGTGQLLEVNLDAATDTDIDYTWDGVFLESETWTGDVAGYVSRTWDSFGQVDELDVDGETFDYDYDGDGRIVQAGSMTVTDTLVDGDHWERTTVLPTTTVEEEFNRHGDLDRLETEVEIAPGTTYPFRYEVTERDYRGRQMEHQEALSTKAITYTHSYDARGRLDAVHRAGSLVANYNYDSNGNRESATYYGAWVHADRPNVASSSTTYDDQDRMLEYGDCTYSYTTAGMLERKSCDGGTEVTDYTYDLLGNLLRVDLPDGREVRYSVDGLGRRVRRQVWDGMTLEEEQRWLYSDGLNPVAELDGSNTLQRVFVYATRANVPDYIYEPGSPATLYRIISDPRGSPLWVVNQTTEAYVQRARYDAFGFILSETVDGSFDRIPFGFAGGLYDPLTGLVRFGARDYDPVAGRWTARDPLLFGGGTPNLYEYSFGDPINYVDIGGENPLLITIITGAGVGAGIEIALQLAANGGNFGCIDWGGVATAAVVGGALGGFGRVAGGALRAATGPLKQWVRIGRSYSRSLGQPISNSVRWGASPAKGGRYLRQIGSPRLRAFNQWLRARRLPPGQRWWRTADPGHFHLRR